MRCGRCLDFCPTFNTGKPLKPRQLIVETSAYMDRQTNLLAGVAGPRASTKRASSGHELATRDEPTLAQVPWAAKLIGDVVSEDEIWDCTTCRACMEQCPVLIEHVPLITELRRNLVLEQSQFPQELQILFNNLERNGNPYSFPASTRADWASGLGVRMLAEVEDPEHHRSPVLGRLHVLVRRPQQEGGHVRWSRCCSRRTSSSRFSGARRPARAIRRVAPATSTCSRSWRSRTSRR